MEAGPAEKNGVVQKKPKKDEASMAERTKLILVSDDEETPEKGTKNRNFEPGQFWKIETRKLSKIFLRCPVVGLRGRYLILILTDISRLTLECDSRPPSFYLLDIVYALIIRAELVLFFLE